MCFARWMLTLASAVVIAVAIAFPIAAQSRKQFQQAQKLLEKLKLVDGAGSGLDADTLQGMTPAQLQASLPPRSSEGPPGPPGSQGPPGPPGPQGPEGRPGESAPSASIVVKDSNGALIGPIVAPDPLRIAYRTNGDLFLLGNLNLHDTRGFNPVILDYVQPDCTGTPFLRTPFTSDVIPVLQLAGANGYYGVGTAQQMQVASTQVFFGEGLYCQPSPCCQNTGTNGIVYVNARRAVTVDLTTLRLVPPFVVPPFHVEGP